MNPLTLWHELRQSRLVLALWDRIRLLEERCDLRRQENAILTLKCEVLTAQLETSRLQHARALQQVDRLEVVVEHLHDQAARCQRMRRKEQTALRTWITREITPQINCN